MGNGIYMPSIYGEQRAACFQKVYIYIRAHGRAPVTGEARRAPARPAARRAGGGAVRSGPGVGAHVAACRSGGGVPPGVPRPRFGHAGPPSSALPHGTSHAVGIYPGNTRFT
jgi:hypothetical protein